MPDDGSESNLKPGRRPAWMMTVPLSSGPRCANEWVARSSAPLEMEQLVARIPKIPEWKLY